MDTFDSIGLKERIVICVFILVIITLGILGTSVAVGNAETAAINNMTLFNPKAPCPPGDRPFMYLRPEYVFVLSTHKAQFGNRTFVKGEKIEIINPISFDLKEGSKALIRFCSDGYAEIFPIRLFTYEQP